MNYDQLKEMANNQSSSDQRRYNELFRAILKRKLFIVISFLLVFAAGYSYLKFTSPAYESTVLLKKEEMQPGSTQDSFSRLISLESQDDISTEMALVKTRNVLDKVVQKLKLNLIIDKIVLPNGEIRKIDKSLPAYNLWVTANHLNNRYPQILDFNYNYLDGPDKLVLEVNGDGRIGLYNSSDNSNVPLDSAPENNLIEINNNNFKVSLYWPAAQTGTKLYFSVYDGVGAYYFLSNKISVSQKDNTNLMEIKVKDGNPEIAQLIARTVVDKFRETRTDQQRQNAQSSYASIDSQLTEMSKKLKSSEDKLSDYQAKNGIANINQSSDEMVRFLSNLEAEKISNDLTLGEYQAKENQILNLYEKGGYFDQTYLSPNQTNSDERSFSTLQQQLSDLEVKKIQLLQKETGFHPDVISVDNQIAQIKKQLSSFNQNTLTAYKIIINSLKGKNNKLENLVSQYQSKIQGLPKKETALAGLIRDKDVYEKVFNILLDKREELRVKELAQLQDIVVVDQASLPFSPFSPNTNLTLVICLFFWGLLVIGYVLVREYTERKYLKLEEIEEKMNLPILSIIPKFPQKLKSKLEKSKLLQNRFAVLEMDNPGINESFKVLQTRLNPGSKNTNKIIMFTSCEENTGKTTIVANLALSLIAANKKVLVVDADLKRCALSDLFEIPRNFSGLSTFLKKDLNAIPVFNLSNLFTLSSKEKMLSILPAGDVNEHSGDLFQSSRTIELINTLKSSIYDYILVDTPPVTRIVDSLILGRIIDNIVMVVRDNHSLRDSVYWGKKELDKEEISIIGIVANACEIEKSSFRNKYGYGYGYKYSYKPSHNKKKKNNLIAAV